MKRILLVMLIVAASLSWSAAPAQAQMGAIRRMSGMTSPSVNSRQLKKYAETLGLDEAQKQTADSLLSAYDTDYLAAVTRMTDLQKAMQEEMSQTGDMSIMRDAMGDAFKKFRRRIDKIEKGFMEDLKSILSEKQLERWPIVERTHRRKTTIGWGSFSGEAMDLIELVEGLRLPPGQSAALTETLEQYAQTLDSELVARNKVVDEQISLWMDQFMSPDPEKMAEQQKSIRESGVRIVDVNKRFARQIEGMLDAEAQGEFKEKVKLASFPMVYRKSYAMRLFETAEKIPNMAQANLDAIKDLKGQYERESAPLNDAWAAAVAEAELADETGMKLFAGQFGQGLPEDVKKAKEAREALDKRMMDSVKSLLTEEQQKLLPDQKFRPEFDYDAATSVK